MDRSIWKQVAAWFVIVGTAAFLAWQAFESGFVDTLIRIGAIPQ